MRILHVVGNRPDLLKVAPLMRALAAHDGVAQLLVHAGPARETGLADDRFFGELDLPRPDLDLGVTGGSHPARTARVMIALEPVLERQRPDWVFVVGDVGPTLGAALVAVQAGVRVAHTEAGLRTHDRSMAGEIHRVLTDALSSALFTTEPAAAENLRREGVPDGRVHLVGNTMIDALHRHRSHAAGLRTHEALGLREREYCLVTLHKPVNVGEADRLAGWLRALQEVRYEWNIPVVFPLHPRTARNIRAFGLDEHLASLVALAPMGYLEFLCLLDHAAVVIADSGGVQEETSVLGVPCITLRSSTDRPITVLEGTNRLFRGEPDDLPDVLREAWTMERRPGRSAFWDGRAAERIAALTVTRLAEPDPPPRRERPRPPAARRGAAAARAHAPG